MVSDRSAEVLKAIVQDYIVSREPVGSRSIVERHPFGVSAATIRNDMASLEEEDLIAAPHTSSGRVPTDKGYRLFVDRLAEVRPLSSSQRRAIEAFLGQSADLDDVLSRTVRLLSQLTHQVALAQYPSLSRAKVRHIELISLSPTRLISVLITDTGHVEQRIIDVPEEVSDDFLADVCSKLNVAVAALGLADAAEALQRAEEFFAPECAPIIRVLITVLVSQAQVSRHDRLVMAGTANLLRSEEDFTRSISSVLEAIEEQVALLRLFSAMVTEQDGVSVSIGSENDSFGLREMSVLTSGYASPGGEVARLGVLGPTRMDYQNNMAAVRAVARYVSTLLSDDVSRV
jgi:heat-inducible transcriptional repressor